MDIGANRRPYEDSITPGMLVWFATRETRLAAIVQSLTNTQVVEHRPVTELQWQTVELRWSELQRCDPVTAAYVWQQLAAAPQFDDDARLAIVAADRIVFRFVTDLSQEFSHGP